MKRLSEKQRKSFKTYGILLIVLGFLFMYMAYTNYRSYSLAVTTGNDAEMVNVNFKKISESSTSGISYVITCNDNENEYHIYTAFGNEFFEHDDFVTNVSDGDSITLYLLYSSSTTNVVSGIEKDGMQFMDRNGVENEYLSSMKSLGKKIVIFIVVSVVLVLGGAALFIIRAIDAKKMKQDLIEEDNKYLASPTAMLPSTRLRSQNILNNPKIKVLSEGEFGDKYNNTKYLDYYKVVNRFENEYETSELIKNISEVNSEEIVNVINKAFGKEKVSVNDIDALKSRNTYHKDLWLGLYEEENLVGILIGDIDNQIKEGSIEYLAVLPEYQNMGFGKKLVNHALSLMKGYAKICTVFSRSDNNYQKLHKSKAF